MEKEVTGCADCPFNLEYDMASGYSCNIDSENRHIKQSKRYQPIDPEWCPLKISDVIIKLKK